MFPKKNVFVKTLPLWLLCGAVILGRYYFLWTKYLRSPVEPAQYAVEPRIRGNVKQKVVILTTQCRSGSSFTGEIFSASEGTMYLYEPLLPFGMDCSALQDRKLALLSRILNCNFTGLQPEYHAGFETSHFPDYGSCLSKGYCFPYASVGLLKGYATTCNQLSNPAVLSSTFNPKSPECGFPLKEQILCRQCLNAMMVFTKVTRACSLIQIQEVYDSLTKNNREAYVLHLVRDPRSTVYSRMKAWNEDPVMLTKVICGRIRKNLEILKEIKSEDETLITPSLVTNGRYLRIRFEDIATDAVGWAKRMFRFIGSELPPEVETNIRDHLQQSSSELKKLLADKTRSQTAQKLLQEMNSPFTAVRDSQEVLRRWRKTIPWNMVLNVQTECADVMEALGYKVYTDEATLRNTSVPYFLSST